MIASLFLVERELVRKRPPSVSDGFHACTVHGHDPSRSNRSKKADRIICDTCGGFFMMGAANDGMNLFNPGLTDGRINGAFKAAMRTRRNNDQPLVVQVQKDGLFIDIVIVSGPVGICARKRTGCKDARQDLGFLRDALQPVLSQTFQEVLIAKDPGWSRRSEFLLRADSAIPE